MTVMSSPDIDAAERFLAASARPPSVSGAARWPWTCCTCSGPTAAA